MAERDNLMAVAYLRTAITSSDSEKRQRLAIQKFADRDAFVLVAEFNDAGVGGAGPVGERPGFAALLSDIADRAVGTVIVESEDRFSHDLSQKGIAIDHLSKLGVKLISVEKGESII